MASNKKWIIAGSITLLVIFGAAMGTGAIIGATTKDEDSYIKIHIGDEELDVNTINLGDEDTTDEAKAKLLESQFYSAALFGKYNLSDTETITENYILNIENADEWNLPYAVESGTSISDLTNEFVKVKFLNDTQDSSVYTYLKSIASTSDDKFAIAALISELITISDDNGLNWPEVSGLDVLSKAEFADFRTHLYETLSKDTSYLSMVYKDIISYTYLWQEPTQNAYDYIFTRELVYASPSMVSTMTLDASSLWALGIEDDADYNTLTSVTRDARGVTATQWNTIFDNFVDSSTVSDITTQDDQINFGGVTGFKGFQGIKFGTQAGSLVESDWTDWDNTWTVNTEATGTTNSENFTNDNILTTGNYYVSSKAYAPGEGAIIKEETDSSGGAVSPDTGSAYVYAYNQIYPYVFQEVSTEGTLQNKTYSLFADKAGDVYTKQADDAVKANYIFDTWFGADNSLYGEIYVAEALMNNKTSLTTSALNYWYHEGFYIELSGTYEDDLSSFIPSEILFDE